MAETTMHYSGNENGTASVTLAGSLDFSNFRFFRELYEPILRDAAVHTIALNFKAVEHVDNAALGMLLMLREKGEKQGKKIMLIQCHGVVQQVLKAAHFDDLFELD